MQRKSRRVREHCERNAEDRVPNNPSHQVNMPAPASALSWPDGSCTDSSSAGCGKPGKTGSVGKSHFPSSPVVKSTAVRLTSKLAVMARACRESTGPISINPTVSGTNSSTICRSTKSAARSTHCSFTSPADMAK
jgi:hypothetical protein